MMHVEFVVVGTPVSNQSPGTSLDNWRAAVRTEAQKSWPKAPLTVEVKAILLHFHPGKVPIDFDNMSKPVFDSLNGVVSVDDRQIMQAEIAHLYIAAPFSFPGVSKLITSAVQANQQFVSVRIEDPVAPYPLPK
jgi:hypothetical protein